MRASFLIAGLALFGSACGSPEEERNRTAISVQSEGQRRLHELDDLNRAIALKRAIHASGKRCERIDRNAYVQEHGNLSMWTATCNDGRSWALFVGPDETVQVRNCEEMEALELPGCRLEGDGTAPA